MYVIQDIHNLFSNIKSNHRWLGRTLFYRHHAWGFTLWPVAKELYTHKHNYGVLHTEHWIWIRCRSGIRIQRLLCLHTVLIWIRAACCTVWQCFGTVREIQSSSATRSLRAMWSSHESTLNLDRDLDPVNPVSVPVWRAPLKTKLYSFLWHKMLSLQDA